MFKQLKRMTDEWLPAEPGVEKSEFSALGGLSLRAQIGGAGCNEDFVTVIKARPASRQQRSIPFGL
jgi:hypothetical protein